MSWANNPHRMKGWRAVFSKNCPHCRTPIRGSATFCPFCSQPTTRVAAPVVMTPERRVAVRRSAHKQAIAALIIIAGIILFALSQAHAQSHQTPLYDKDGHYSGSVINNGDGTTTYTDRDGKFSGSAIDNRNGTTSFFNRNGQFSGSAGSSIDRAFNFNKR